MLGAPMLWAKVVLALSKAVSKCLVDITGQVTNCCVLELHPVNKKQIIATILGSLYHCTET